MTESIPALVERVWRAVIRAEDGAGSLPAKEAVKLRPADWHAVTKLAREAADALAPLAQEVERLKALVSSSEAERYRSCGELLACATEAEARAAQAVEEALLKVDDLVYREIWDQPPPTEDRDTYRDGFTRGVIATSSKVREFVRTLADVDAASIRARTAAAAIRGGEK